MNVKGRPQKYTDEDLKEILIKFATENGGKINPHKLEKETGIKRHVWTRRMGEEIDRINNNELSLNPETLTKLPLPNIVDVIDKYYNNKDELVRVLSGYNDYIQRLWDKGTEYDKLNRENQKLKQDLSFKDEEIKSLKSNRDFYKNEYEKIVVESTYQHKREEKNIKNVIDLNKKENFDKTVSVDWNNSFPDLFKDQ